MPFPSSGTYPVSNKDLLSFTFDDPEYDIDRPVFIDPRAPSIYFSHRSAKDLVCHLIAGLRAIGLKKDDTVCIHSFNSIVYPLLVLAIIGAGGRSVGTNPSYTRNELNHGVKVAKIRFVFTEPEIMRNMLQALQESQVDVGSRLFVLDTQLGQEVPIGMKSWRTLLSHGTEDWQRCDSEAQSHHTAQLYFTSGTTGLPKCTMTSHKNLVAEHQLFYEASPRDYPIKLVLCLPFFHVGNLPQALISVLKEGREAYVMRRFELESFLSYHARYSLTETFMVPPMVISIVMSGFADPKSDKYRPDYSLKSVRHGTVGAAPCSGDIQERFQKLLGDGATFSQVWGMTETTTVACRVPSEMALQCSRGDMKAWGSVGIPLPMTMMKLIDERGNDVTDQGKGELCVKGPTVVKGYFENDKATRDSWDSEGYFKTGDVIQVDPQTKLLYVVERVKELIKVRGFQVAPAELEGALTEHPNIVDAAVIGIETGDDIESPKAYIVRRPGSDLTKQDVHDHMHDRLARYKQLTGGVSFVESIPKLPSGKILKRVLREQAKSELRARMGTKI